MIHRPAPHGIDLITQPAHAWLSGQMARAWGNERFARPEPREDVCLAAEQHDVAWAEWELHPTRNPANGFPHTVFDVPVEEHAGVWTGSGRKALVYGRYPALLVSLHGTGFYDGTNRAQLPAARRHQLEVEQAFQKEMRDQLAADPAYAFTADPDIVMQHHRLVATVDWISLVICMRMQARVIERVPERPGVLISMAINPAGDEGRRWRLDPWPFARPELTLSVDARHLAAPAEDDAALVRALAEAPWVRHTLTLIA